MQGVLGPLARLESVLSIGKVGGGNGDPTYYLDSVATGQEDYYTGSGEAPGQWAGTGAAALGLHGVVEDAAFLKVLDRNDDPANKSVLGYDLTFSAPKSVSILYGVSDAEDSRLTRDAHDAAVRDALGYLEREACWTRRGRNGVALLQGEGLTVALFRHRSSRAGDPQLHTHAVVANGTRAAGRTTTLDGRALYAHAKTASYLYQASLRRELTERLGVEWTPVEKGIAEIRGIDERLRRHFSQRRDEIVERMREHGGRSARSAEIATLETRRIKNYNVSARRMRDEWRARAAELGLVREEVAGLTQRELGRRRLDATAVAETLEAPSGLTERTSAFDRRDVVRAWAEAHREGASAQEIEQLTDAWLTRSGVVQLDSGRTRRQVGGARYSTEELLRIETRLLDGAAARQHDGVAQVDPVMAEHALAVDDSLSEEQRHLARSVTTSGRGVEVIRAAAGTGKTRALAVARDIWEGAGTHVYGTAIAARAAVELEQTAGIDSVTIARLLADLDHGYGLTPGSVLVVDEAGMTGTRALARLADHAAATESKLLLVGDDHQLPELDAGGAFRALTERLGAVELREVHRQDHDWDREALSDLRAGRIEAWATTYRDRGRLVARPTAAALRDVLVDDWWECERAGPGEAVMIAHRRNDVAALNAAARARMQRDGRLGDEQVTTDRLSFAVGDRVIARCNDRRQHVVNGTLAEVIDLDVDRRSLLLRTDAGDEREIDAAYVDAGRLEHGYALTAHAAQGATVDRAFVLGGDDLYREWGYTALTRHRESATFYIVSPGTTERALPGLEDGDALMNDIRRALGGTRRQSTATEVATADLRRETQERIATLAEERSSLRFWARRRRSELDELIVRQEEALERFAAKPSREPARPRSAPPPDIDHDRLRASLVDPPAAVTDLVGPRPTQLAERECWTRCVARLLASDGPRIARDRTARVPTAAERSMDYDTGLDL